MNLENKLIDRYKNNLTDNAAHVLTLINSIVHLECLDHVHTLLYISDVIEENPIMSRIINCELFISSNLH